MRFLTGKMCFRTDKKLVPTSWGRGATWKTVLLLKKESGNVVQEEWMNTLSVNQNLYTDLAARF